MFLCIIFYIHEPPLKLPLTTCIAWWGCMVAWFCQPEPQSPLNIEDSSDLCMPVIEINLNQRTNATDNSMSYQLWLSICMTQASISPDKSRQCSSFFLHCREWSGCLIKWKRLISLAMTSPYRKRLKFYQMLVFLFVLYEYSKHDVSQLAAVYTCFHVFCLPT